MQFEVDYSPLHIKKLTPYLNKVETPKTQPKSKKKSYLTLKHRSFCWYFIHNGNKKSDAYRRAYLAKFNKKNDKLVLNDLSGTKYYPTRVAVEAGRLFSYAYIQEAIALIHAKNMRDILKKIPQTAPGLIEQYIIQATYDPSMFMNEFGGPKFKSWDDIPEKYRICVEGIETKIQGKSERPIVTIKLVDRDKARDQLLKMAPGLLSPEQYELLHTTLDKEGKKVGINTDYNKLSDDALLKIINSEGK